MRIPVSISSIHFPRAMALANFRTLLSTADRSSASKVNHSFSSPFTLEEYSTSRRSLLARKASE